MENTDWKQKIQTEECSDMVNMLVLEHEQGWETFSSVQGWAEFLWASLGSQHLAGELSHLLLPPPAAAGSPQVTAQWWPLLDGHCVRNWTDPITLTFISVPSSTRRRHPLADWMCLGKEGQQQCLPSPGQSCSSPGASPAPAPAG